MTEIKCLLKCVQNTHEPFLLKNDEEVTFGRGPDTKIKDSRCSRTQIKLKANYDKKNVAITQIGRNACGLNGMALKKDSTVTVKHGDRIEILLGQYIHVIEFEPPPDTTGNLKKTRKSVSSSASDSQTSNKSAKHVLEVEDDKSTAKRSRLDIKSDWESVDDGKLLVYTPENVKPSCKIAAYDLDGTIIGTASGKVFPKNKDDWKILFQEVLVKLKLLHSESYKILIFTNQAGISAGKTNVNDFKSKVESIIKKLNVPVQVFVATGHTIYRKPALGMWEAAMERNDNLEVDRSKSFFCGDAAGREKNHQMKKDFSHTDILFAKNLGLNFETPEYHFLKHRMPLLKIKVFDPRTIPCDVPLCEPSSGTIISNKLEVVILVGFPGSGKTHFAKTHLIPAGYVHINRDTLGSWTKCANAMTAALSGKQSVVIDNTNPDVESRKRFITLAKNYTSSIRCFVMNTSMQHAKHNNKFRLLTDPSQAVSDVVIHTYASKYKEPTLEEGFSEILKINFWLTFKNAEHEKLYKLYLLEK
ncbi:hypothetical protein RUM44_010836 [Polyplax serrata]|uniref:PNK FHA domain-containing protein n=1 Tax=Polyplax serrata TaxID=468196 RepID=A0ABR1AND2_POLSC